MAEFPLSQTVDASSAKRGFRSSVLSLLTSMLLQGLAIAVAVVAPLIAMQSLPQPESRWSMPAYVPVVPAPPRTSVPRPRPRRAVSATKPPTSATVLDSFHVPIEIPTGIPDEADFAPGDDDLGGVAGGLPDGVGAPMSQGPDPEPRPTIQGPVKPGGVIREPRKIHHVNPVYPKVALQARIHGTVVLETTIGVDGNIVDVRVATSIALLDQAAIEAVRQWKYEPTRLNGVPVPVLLTVEVVFRLSS